MDILKDLWYGNLEPQEMAGDDLKKANEYAEKVYDSYDRLANKLSNESQKLLDEYVEAFEKYNCFLEEKAFKCGFKLAVQAIVKSLQQ